MSLSDPSENLTGPKTSLSDEMPPSKSKKLIKTSQLPETFPAKVYLNLSTFSKRLNKSKPGPQADLLSMKNFQTQKKLV